VVVEEIAHGDPDAAQRRQQSIAAFPVLEVVPESMPWPRPTLPPFHSQARPRQMPITWPLRPGMESIIWYRGIVRISSVVASGWSLKKSMPSLEYGPRLSAPPKNLWRLAHD
jgi:hypothetical protein